MATPNPTEPSTVGICDGEPEKQSQEGRKKEKCKFCDGMYIRVKTHISKSHPNEYAQGISDTYQPSQTEDEKDKSEALKRINQEMDGIHKRLVTMLENQPNEDEFSGIVAEVTKIMKDAPSILPGPKNPKTKYYEARKKRSLFSENQNQHKNSSNPQKTSKREKNRRKEKYNYELMQYMFKYSRKKAVRMVLEKSMESKVCKIPMEEITEFYNNRWGTPKDNVLEDYGPSISVKQQEEIDEEHKWNVTEEAVKQALKKINSDSAAGLDGVPVKVLKLIKCHHVLASIANIMIKFNLVPKGFRSARTVLIHKKGDERAIQNWRPISICSVLRRVIEKIIESKLKEFITLSDNQVGFSSQPGCFINTSILSASLIKAKLEKKDLCIVLLDVEKAFEETSHPHLENVLHSKPIPTTLRNITLNLMRKNQTVIQTSGGTSREILVKRGVFQGCPLSPLLFNLSVDHVLKELAEPSISSPYGFTLHNDVANVSGLGFADDLALESNSTAGVIELTKIATSSLGKVGYKNQASKCKAINIKKGELCEDPIIISSDFTIKALQKGETMSYLGVDFSDQIKLDKANLIQNFAKDLQNLVSTPMLHGDQQLSIINQYIWPTVIYSLQTTPIGKIPKSFTSDLDKLIRSTVKNIVGIPADSPTAMIYAPKKNRGLQVLKTSWETYIQHYNVCMALLSSNNKYIPFVRDLEAEMSNCLQELKITDEELSMESSKRSKTKHSKILRELLQNSEYVNWCEYNQKGKGVELYQQYPHGNKLILEKQSITSAEWTAAIKMSSNVYPVRAIPGRSPDTRQCRHCTETETLPHVLGSCQKGQLMRILRHNEVRTIIADHLRRTNWKVYEELHCLGENDSNRRVDILCFRPGSNKGYILDPTIRFEGSLDQPEQVNQEKKNIYMPCVQFFLEKYPLKEIEVRELLIGARGTITTLFENFRKEFLLPKSMNEDIIVSIIRNSSKIAHNHCYNTIT